MNQEVGHWLRKRLLNFGVYLVVFFLNYYYYFIKSNLVFMSVHKLSVNTNKNPDLADFTRGSLLLAAVGKQIISTNL